MATELPALELAAELARARAKIDELETANRLLREHRALPASLRLPSVILESITEAFVAVDRDFRYIWVNTEAERLLGIPRDRLLGNSIWQIFPDIAGTVFEEKSRQALRERTTVEFESYHPPWDRWFYSKIYPTSECGLAIYWREITEQKRAQAEVRRQAQFLEQIHDAIIAADLDAVITYWNHGAERIFGYAAQEIVGQRVSVLYFEQDRAQVGPAVLEPLLRDGIHQVELRNRRKSGEECYIRLSLSLLRDDSGRPCGMLGVSIDVTAQKRAEQALRESEERYRCLTDAMPQVVFVTDTQGKTELVNRYWEQYSGVPADQCAELNWLAWVHPDDVPGHAADWMECVRTGKRFERLYRLRNAAGEYRWHLARALPLRGADGNIRQWIGTSTDVHDRRKAAEALERSEERFHLAFRAVQGVLYDWDVRSGIVHRAGDMEDLFGVSAEEADPNIEWYRERIHPDDLALSSGNLASVAPDRQRFEAEYRVRHAAGHWVDVYDRSIIVRDETGAPVRLVGNGQNVTLRKQLERDLAASRERLQFQADVLAAINDAVIVFGPGDLIEWCNAGVERIYGIRSPDVIGKPRSAVYAAEWLDPADEPRASASMTDRGFWSGEKIHLRLDGTQVVVGCTWTRLSPALGGGWVAVIRDISEQKRAELELHRRAAQLALANQDLLHFAYAASHDLGAPLRAITSFSELLRRDHQTQLDSEGLRLSRWIAEAGARMTAMLDDLTQFARLAGENRAGEEFLLDDALTAALENLRVEIEDTGAVISRDSLPAISGHAMQLTQLFQNLIGNSLKYRKKDTQPEIHVSVQRTAGEWVISVRDHGIGFDPKFAERIFGVFQRLHSTEFAGTGMGLAICRKIVERHGGRIWATAVPGEGAVFFFSIPAGEQP